MLEVGVKEVVVRVCEVEVRVRVADRLVVVRVRDLLVVRDVEVRVFGATKAGVVVRVFVLVLVRVVVISLRETIRFRAGKTALVTAEMVNNVTSSAETKLASPSLLIRIRFGTRPVKSLTSMEIHSVAPHFMLIRPEARNEVV